MPLALVFPSILSQLPPLFVVVFALHCICEEQASEIPTLITCAAGAGCKEALAKVRPPGDTWSKHCGVTVRLTYIDCGLSLTMPVPELPNVTNPLYTPGSSVL